MNVLLAAIFAFLISAALVPVCRIISFRLNCVAHPSPDRWHRRVPPLLGGVAIAGGVLSGAMLFGVAADLRILLVSGAVIFAVGVADDVMNLKPATKLIAEIAVASILLFFGFR